MTTHLTGVLTAEYYTLEFRPVPEDPKSDDTPWEPLGNPAVATFRTPQEAQAAAVSLNEDGLQTRVLVHRMISTELMRFF